VPVVLAGGDGTSSSPAIASRGTGRHVRPGGGPKHARRLGGFNVAVLSLCAKGMTTGCIAAHLSGVYGTEV